MKKYFLKETGECIKFGDIIALDLEGKNKKGNILHEHIEVKFTPLLVDMLKDEEVIVEKILNKESIMNTKIDYEKFKKYPDNNKFKREAKLEARIAELENRITELEGIIAEWDNE